MKGGESNSSCSYLAPAREDTDYAKMSQVIWRLFPKFVFGKSFVAGLIDHSSSRHDMGNSLQDAGVSGPKGWPQVKAFKNKMLDPESEGPDATFLRNEAVKTRFTRVWGT